MDSKIVNLKIYCKKFVPKIMDKFHTFSELVKIQQNICDINKLFDQKLKGFNKIFKIDINEVGIKNSNRHQMCKIVISDGNETQFKCDLKECNKKI
jgi:hypothetical protein